MKITKEAVKRILNVNTVYSIRFMPNGCIQATYHKNGGRCSTFISKKAFERDHVAVREANSSNIVVPYINLSHSWAKVYNKTKKTEYIVDFKNQQCSCHDCRVNGNHCKHLIAVNNSLPF